MKKVIINSVTIKWYIAPSGIQFPYKTPLIKTLRRNIAISIRNTILNALNMTPPPIPIPPHQWISLRTQKFSIT